MYYLRTKAAAAAIQFTVDKTKLKASNDAIQEKGKKKKKAIQVTHFKDLWGIYSSWRHLENLW